VLRERLLFKLEAMLEQLNADGIRCRTFTVMSGYRTPYYNSNLRNVRYSRHLWGDAADIFVDNDPSDNYIADLNGDGKRDQKDLDMLYHIVSELNERPSFEPFVGGLGRYESTKNHGPFIHVDARGTRATWGS
jgi:uncharacterized protein YcbK (DUF882 family)